MRTSEIAKRFLAYFEKHGHLVTPSASLISPNPTTLFTIAGMVPFIPYLLGEQTPPSRRMASNQKCVRTLDIDEVGKTTRHGTFFQMLGNFSFGDYFKEEAIHYAWDLLTSPQDQGGYGFGKDTLWVTTYTDDDEARALWRNEGMDPEHMQVLGMEDNFWTTGGPGPGGPCTEIYVDRGPEYGPDGGPVASETRYIEIWDLVFENFEVDNVKSKTDLHIVGELDSKNIDTGMGLERVAYLLQGKQNIYETDEIFPVIAEAERLSGLSYGDDAGHDVRFRVVADHIRSALMIMGDGVRPSNEGRGYVLRRLLRRSIRAMKMLGVEQEVLPHLLPVSQEQMRLSYPELDTNFDSVCETAYGEEAAFRRTLDQGSVILDTAIRKAKQDTQPESAGQQEGSGRPVVSGSDAFALHDTYGFPIELTTEIAAEQGIAVDTSKFRKLMAEQKSRARADALKKRHNVDLSVYDDVKKALEAPIEFTGYKEYSSRGRVLAIIDDERGAVQEAAGPATVEIILDRTPFYAEQGGQMADYGEISSDNGATAEVDDVQKPVKDLYVHHCRLAEGTLHVVDEVSSSVDIPRRIGMTHSHTATHILHKVVREVLGDKATQSGSVVDPDRLRFDFHWSKALTRPQLDEIEARVNARIRDDLEVTWKNMPINDAMELGAMHLFGDKYGDIVRVVTIGSDGWSRELCGGTHARRTGTIGSFTLISESSVGTGLRRIEALVGEKSYEFTHSQHMMVSRLADGLNARPDEIERRISQLEAKLRESDSKLALIYGQQIESMVPQLVKKGVQDDGPVIAVTQDVGTFGSADALRKAVTDIRAQLGSSRPAAVALAGVSNDTGKPVIFVAVNGPAQDSGIKAGDLVRSASAILGGGGGGKPDFAQGGGQNAQKIGEALRAVEQQVRSQQISEA